ncbi:hypothetical protein D3C80_1479470 [compost metagenome]
MPGQLAYVFPLRRFSKQHNLPLEIAGVVMGDQTVEAFAQCRFARAVAADDRNEIPLLEAEGNLLQHWLLRAGIRKGDIPQFQYRLIHPAVPLSAACAKPAAG